MKAPKALPAPTPRARRQAVRKTEFSPYSLDNCIVDMSHICNDMTRLVLGGAAILGASLATAQVYEDNLPLHHPAIQYRHEPADDPVARLGRELEGGNAALRHDPAPSYLPTPLDRLGVSIDSQTLVFSK